MMMFVGDEDCCGGGGGGGDDVGGIGSGFEPSGSPRGNEKSSDRRQEG